MLIGVKNMESMQNMQNNEQLSEVKALKENLRIQKAAYIKQQLERRRAAEDARLELLQQEQEIIQDLRESTDDSRSQTEEARKHNQEFQEYINMQVYESNGITEDKLVGMSEYKNAIYRGSAAVLFFLSLVMIVLCGVLHGFGSNICLFMFAYTAMEGALLSQEKKQYPVLDFVSKILYIMTFPTMLVMFVCYELQYGEYDLFLPYTVVLGVLVTVLGTISYFLHDPYIQDKKKVRDAQNQIRNIEKIAEKEVRKKHKIREKEERNTRKLLEREERKNQSAFEKAETAESGGQAITAKIAGFLARFRKQDQPQIEAAESETEEIIQADETEEKTCEPTTLTENEPPSEAEPESYNIGEQSDVVL